MGRVNQEYYQSRVDSILAAATDVFARKGAALATMQDVADAAGISVGAIYRYYAGKEQLVRAVFDRIQENTSLLFLKAAEQAASPAGLLDNAARVIGERFRQDPTREQTILVLEAILADARCSDELVAERRQLRETYLLQTEQWFRQAQAVGALDPNLDPGAFALLFVSLMVGMHVLALETPDVWELDAALEVVNEMLLRFAPRPNALSDLERAVLEQPGLERPSVEDPKTEITEGTP